MNDRTRILVTGALGQIGSELIVELRRRHGGGQVVAADIREEVPEDFDDSGPFECCDVTDAARLAELVQKHRVGRIVHLAAILSATGEKNPGRAWEVNMGGLWNVLEVARTRDLEQVLCPSSIAVFGPDAPKQQTPQVTWLQPTTMYGITKVAGELLCDYYFRRYGIDARGLRYPGIISHLTPPGGGTTDYAVEIFREAIRHRRYTCFVSADTVLPMMYMPDCIRATIELMEAPIENLNFHGGYNVASMSFSAGELANEIRRHIPEFTCTYEPDERQGFADSWPQSIDDRAAREDWGWMPEYNLASMTTDMLEKLRERATGLQEPQVGLR
ncbi:MAG: NAD-dependent epimerase/dehydratase family protein [Candidatus Eiseniibacteriota bacterium]|jgi:nucleoside-diphosphate-sugar epimerase